MKADTQTKGEGDVAKAQKVGSAAVAGTDYTYLCPHDGAALSTTKGRQGYCETGDGFPLMRWFWHPEARQGKGAWEAQGWKCPFVCPHCTSDLEWDGCCLACGPRAGAPGDRYKRQRNHLVYERGPEAPMTQDQHVNLLLKLKALTASLA